MNENKQIKLPDSMLDSIKEAQETYKKLQDNIKSIIPKIPKIDVSYIKDREFFLPPSMDVVQEENNWKRHNEVLETQNTLLSVLKEILKEQQSGSRMTKLIIGLTVLGILATIFSAFL